MKNVYIAISFVMLVVSNISAMKGVLTREFAQAAHLESLEKLQIDVEGFFKKVQHKNEAADIREDVSKLIHTYNCLVESSEMSNVLKERIVTTEISQKILKSFILSELVSKASRYISYRDSDYSVEAELLGMWHDIMELFKKVSTFPEISREWKEKVDSWLKANYEILS